MGKTPAARQGFVSFKIRNCDRLFAKVRRQPPHIGAGRDIGIKQQPRAFVIVQRADGNIRWAASFSSASRASRASA